MSDPQFIEWRRVRLAAHGPYLWLSDDRLWKLTMSAGNGDQYRWVASLQLGPERLFVDFGATPSEALDRLALQVGAIAEQLTVTLRAAGVRLRTLDGHVVNGQIVLDEPTPLTDGTPAYVLVKPTAP